MAGRGAIPGPFVLSSPRMIRLLLGYLIAYFALDHSFAVAHDIQIRMLSDSGLPLAFVASCFPIHCLLHSKDQLHDENEVNLV